MKQKSNHQKISLQGIQISTGISAGADADKQAICKGCIQGFVGAMAEGVGLDVASLAPQGRMKLPD